MIARGERVRRMADLASSMWDASPQVRRAALAKANEECRPPLAAVELNSILHNVGRYSDAMLLEEPHTDGGNARVFARAHAHHLRYASAERKWYAYIDGLWRPDETGHAERAAKEVARERLRVASGDEARKWALRSQDGPHQRALLEAARTEPGIALRVEKMDADPWLLACANGIVDLQTGELREHDAARLISRGTGIEYDPDAKCSRWERFISEVFAGDDDLAAFVQRAVGYTLTGDTREEVLLILHGDGANGKSTFVEVLALLLGDLARTVNFSETWAKKRSAAIRNDVARLRGARFVSSQETQRRRGLDEEVVKSITGGDRIAARFLYGEHFEFVATFKVWLATNHRPKIDASDEAMWRRVRLIPFAVSFRGREDRTLDADLRAELPGILRWAVDGCLAWQREGLGHADAVTQAGEAYREAEDTLRQFLDEMTYEGGQVRIGDLHEALEGWCRKRGDEVPVSKKAIADAVVQRRPDVQRARTKAAKVLDGISLDPVLG